MVSLFKSLQSVFQSVLSDLPEGLTVLTEFVWKSRWFILTGFVLYWMYNVVMVTLPFILWSFAIKTVVGSVFSLLFSL